MAGPQPISAIQFSDLPPWAKVAVILAAVAAVASGLLLPRWITVLGIAAAFLTTFVVLKLRRRG